MTFLTKIDAKPFFSANAETLHQSIDSVTENLIDAAIEAEVDGAADIGADFDANGLRNGPDDKGQNYYGQIVDLLDLSGYGIDEENGITVYRPQDIEVLEVVSHN